MKIEVPGVGSVNACVDDSCDGAHCNVCGGHFLDFYNGQGTCSSCDGMDDEQQQQVRAAVKAKLDELYPVEPGAAPWEQPANDDNRTQANG